MNLRIEKKAKELLEKLSLIGIVPIDPFAVAKALGINVEFVDFSEDVSGALLRSPDAATRILVNKKDVLNRKRFSVAHELGHFTLSHPGDYFVNNFSLNKRDMKSSYAIDPKEIEANAFAAALLMPEEAVLKLASSLFEDKKISTQEEFIGKLAKAFKVSESAMGYRLVNLGLVTAV
jgi:Zn-dependent peptidase ImmA (M78 family)